MTRKKKDKAIWYGCRTSVKADKITILNTKDGLYHIVIVETRSDRDVWDVDFLSIFRKNRKFTLDNTIFLNFTPPFEDFPNGYWTIFKPLFGCLTTVFPEVERNSPNNTYYQELVKGVKAHLGIVDVLPPPPPPIEVIPEQGQGQEPIAVAPTTPSQPLQRPVKAAIRQKAIRMPKANDKAKVAFDSGPELLKGLIPNSDWAMRHALLNLLKDMAANKDKSLTVAKSSPIYAQLMALASNGLVMLAFMDNHKATFKLVFGG